MKRGFTLIELLIVIFIISILIVTTVVYLNYARQDARDSKRKNDLDKIKTALDLYFNQNETFPLGSNQLQPNGTTVGSDWTSWNKTTGTPVSYLAQGLQPYLSPLPVDPLNKNQGALKVYVYYYVVEADQSGYILATCLENPKTDDPNYKIWHTGFYNYILRGGTCSQGTCSILSL